jgi:hypothetical protein
VPVDELHHEEADAVDLLDREQGDDVRVIEAGDAARLAFEPRQAVRIGGERRRQDLDRDLPSEPGVAGAPNFTHAAGPERGDDFVGAESGPNGEGHSRQFTASGRSIALSCRPVGFEGGAP